MLPDTIAAIRQTDPHRTPVILDGASVAAAIDTVEVSEK